MTGCCEKKTDSLEALATSQRRTLWLVFFINFFMFLFEAAYGFVADSSALLADSLDMFADAAAYGVSLYAVSMGAMVKARVSYFKGLLMIFLGLLVFLKACYRLYDPVMPSFDMMFWVSIAALLANLWCLKLLWKHRFDDINFSSVWLCSRNDIMANSAVILSAVCIYYTGSYLFDIFIAAVISLLFLRSGFLVTREAKTILANFSE